MMKKKKAQKKVTAVAAKRTPLEGHFYTAQGAAIKPGSCWWRVKKQHTCTVESVRVGLADGIVKFTDGTWAYVREMRQPRLWKRDDLPNLQGVIDVSAMA